LRNMDKLAVMALKMIKKQFAIPKNSPLKPDTLKQQRKYGKK
jgi:hypothetical protein